MNKFHKLTLIKDLPNLKAGTVAYARVNEDDDTFVLYDTPQDYKEEEKLYDLVKYKDTDFVEISFDMRQCLKGVKCSFCGTETMVDQHRFYTSYDDGVKSKMCVPYMYCALCGKTVEFKPFSAYDSIY